MAKRVYSAKIATMMAARGQPIYGEEKIYADMYRNALKAGCTERQAACLLSDAYNAANRYDWQLSGTIQYITRERQANECPNGKWAWVRANHPHGLYASEAETVDWASRALASERSAVA